MIWPLRHQLVRRCQAYIGNHLLSIQPISGFGICLRELWHLFPGMWYKKASSAHARHNCFQFINFGKCAAVPVPKGRSWQQAALQNEDFGSFCHIRGEFSPRDSRVYWHDPCGHLGPPLCYGQAGRLQEGASVWIEREEDAARVEGEADEDGTQGKAKAFENLEFQQTSTTTYLRTD